MVYTYVGDIVISVNPFKNTGCVGKGIRAKYKGGQRSHLPPHIYALVDQTYNTMVRDGTSQSILISGESGAGKTEAMKICLTYISQVCPPHRAHRCPTPQPSPAVHRSRSCACCAPTIACLWPPRGPRFSHGRRRKRRATASLTRSRRG